MDEDRSAEVNIIVPEEGTTSSQGGVVVANAEEGETSPQGEVVVASAGEGATEEEAVLLEEKEEAKGGDGEGREVGAGERGILGRRRNESERMWCVRRESEMIWNCWLGSEEARKRDWDNAWIEERRLAEVRESAREDVGDGGLEELGGGV
jgi:hypothetical protein